MGRSLWTFCGAFIVVATAGCTTKVFTFKTGSQSQVRAVSPSQLDEDGTLLGVTPLTVDLDQLAGKVVKISQAGKQSVYWVVAEAAGDTTEATIKLLDDPASGAVAGQTAAGKVDPKATVNRVLRLLMKAYQALSGKRFQVARELADQASAIDPELAAPQLIKGLAFYQEGNTAEAKAALARAQALDPEDKDIDTLLKVVR